MYLFSYLLVSVLTFSFGGHKNRLITYVLFGGNKKLDYQYRRLSGAISNLQKSFA